MPDMTASGNGAGGVVGGAAGGGGGSTSTNTSPNCVPAAASSTPTSARAGGSAPLTPTFHGFVSNSMDALVLFEACLTGKLHHVPRRPHDRERTSLVKSGSIFIYEENVSGIKRWTDGIAWSPSRILGNFLIYRELTKPFAPGEKKRAIKRKAPNQLDDQSRRASDVKERSDSIATASPPTPPSPPQASEPTSAVSAGNGLPSPPTTTSNESSDPQEQMMSKEMWTSLVGSLTKSYEFRDDGLLKKTMSVTIKGIQHHLVSYYNPQDVTSGKLPRPLSDPRLAGITVRPELYLKQNFRSPIEESEHYVVDPSSMHAHPGGYTAPNMMAYAMQHPTYSHGYMYTPQPPSPYGQAPMPIFRQPYNATYGQPPQQAYQQQPQQVVNYAPGNAQAAHHAYQTYHDPQTHAAARQPATPTQTSPQHSFSDVPQNGSRPSGPPFGYAGNNAVMQQPPSQMRGGMQQSHEHQQPQQMQAPQQQQQQPQQQHHEAAMMSARFIQH